MNILDRFRIVASSVTAGLLFSALNAAPVQAQEWPARPVRIIVPAPPAGNTDTAARFISDVLSKQLGQPFVVDNRGGAAGIIGVEAVAKAPADGYTLLLGSMGPMTVNPGIFDKLPYDSRASFQPVGIVFMAPLVAVVKADSDIRSIRDLIARAREEDGKLTYATGGNGTASHLASEWFASVAGVKMTHIPYKGAAPATSAVVSGEVAVSFTSPSLAEPLVKGGRLRVIGTTSSHRSEQFPQVPTIAESGLPKFEVQDWYGLFAPAGTPPAIVQRLNTEINRFLQLPQTRQTYAGRGLEVRQVTPEQFGTILVADLERWTRTARAARIKAD